MKKQLPYIVGSLALFIVLALIYFNPVLSGNKIFQQDIMQFKGGAEELIKYRDTFDEETYWSDSMFSGMPTYQSGANFKPNFLHFIDQAFGLFLPRPISYFFMMFAGFFFLGLLWLKDWKYALTGALFFGFSTYFYQITEAGHNAKVHTIVYFAPFVGGLWLLYKNKYFIGFVLCTLFLALQLNANHPQMTFYLGIGMMAFGLYKLYFAVKDKEVPQFLKSTAILIVATIFAISLNSGRLLSTYQYSKESTRGQSELTQSNENKTSGLDKDYITEWSYGILETMNLMIPNFYGGGSTEKEFKSPQFDAIQKTVQAQFYQKAEPYLIQQDSLGKVLQTDPNNQIAYQEYSAIEAKLGEMQQQFSQTFQGYSGSYWGNQPFTSGPAYVGSIVVFLAILALFWIRHPYKWWLLGATLLSFMMAWGKNFEVFTNFMIDYFPFYNKFRAVSSALVVSEFTIPALAMLGLYEMTRHQETEIRKKNEKILLIVGGIIMVMLLIFYIAGDSILPFSNSVESEKMTAGVLEAIRSDRFEFFKEDILRTAFFIGVALIALYAYFKNYLKQSIYLLGILVLFSTIDLWKVDRKYLNKDSFVEAKYMNNPFPTDINDGMISAMKKQPKLQNIFALAPMNRLLKEIKENDKDIYRVFNLAYNPFQENNTSYFHQSLGGYHGVKLGRYQEIIETYLSGQPNAEVVNMLNAKYIIQGSPQEPKPIINSEANGNAWFVQNVTIAQSADEELSLLKDLKTKREAVVVKDLKTKGSFQYEADTTATIKLNSYLPNKISYTSRSKTDQFGVFSEIYYDKGWKATIDGVETPILKTNYILRGMMIPKGEHTIVFEFQPSIVKTGSMIQLWSFIIFIAFIFGYLFKNKNEVKDFITSLKK